jgi:3-oxoacyl-[acyl-carrier-protein] synthase-3
MDMTVHRASRVAGLGKYVPSRVLTNSDLERMVETSDQWIRERTGVRERRLAADDETTSTMGIRAARGALEVAHLDPAELDLIIAATSTPDAIFPPVSSFIQEGLGAKRAATLDINTTCVGFISGLATASQFIATGVYERALIVSSDVLSRIVDWTDRSTCVLFGDGAGALVLEAADRGGPLSFVLRSDGSGANVLYTPGPCGRPGSAVPGQYFMKMDGQPVFKFAVNAMERATREALAGAGLTVEDVDLFVPHQANLRILTATARALRLPREKTMVSIDRYGNTSSASIPIALHEAWQQGRLHEGDRVVLAAFGGGLVWGAMVLEWTAVGPSRAREETQAQVTTGGS